MSNIETIVIVGAGQAGASAILELRSNKYEGNIILIGDETHLPYERPPLSKDVILKPENTKIEIFSTEKLADFGVITIRGNGVVKINATAKTVELQNGDVVAYDKLLLATGGAARRLPNFDALGKHVYTLRNLEDSQALVPVLQKGRRIILIGGGVIGLELGSVYLRLGSQVTVVEYMDKIIPTMDGALSKELTKVLKKQGMKFMLSTGVQSVERNGDSVKVTAKDKKGEEVSVDGDYVLVSVGRKPYTEGLGLENAGVDLDERGRVKVNDHLQTNVANIYAIGDVVKGAMLAHKAEEEGVFVAETLAGQKPHINYNLIPGVVYTWPEVAGVGKTEEQLKEEGAAYKVGSFPMRALGRSRASGDIDGLIKVLADEKTDEILGVHMIGARAADMIAEAVIAMEFRASAEDIARSSHAHPTFTEAIKEACLDATGKRSIHM